VGRKASGLADVAKREDITVVRFGSHNPSFLSCAFCAFLWLQKQVALMTLQSEKITAMRRGSHNNFLSVCAFCLFVATKASGLDDVAKREDHRNEVRLS
jgi:hypothetical protein